MEQATVFLQYALFNNASECKQDILVSDINRIGPFINGILFLWEIGDTVAICLMCF